MELIRSFGLRSFVMKLNLQSFIDEFVKDKN